MVHRVQEYFRLPAAGDNMIFSAAPLLLLLLCITMCLAGSCHISPPGGARHNFCVFMFVFCCSFLSFSFSSDAYGLPKCACWACRLGLHPVRERVPGLFIRSITSTRERVPVDRSRVPVDGSRVPVSSGTLSRVVRIPVDGHSSGHRHRRERRKTDDTSMIRMALK